MLPKTIKEIITLLSHLCPALAVTAVRSLVLLQNGGYPSSLWDYLVLFIISYTGILIAIAFPFLVRAVFSPKSQDELFAFEKERDRKYFEKTSMTAAASMWILLELAKIYN